jgi:hypothetical protein
LDLRRVGGWHARARATASGHDGSERETLEPLFWRKGSLKRLYLVIGVGDRVLASRCWENEGDRMFDVALEIRCLMVGSNVTRSRLSNVPHPHPRPSTPPPPFAPSRHVD